VFDIEKEAAFNYSGRVFHTGPLEQYDPAAGGLSLTRRRYAVRKGLGIPELLEVQEIPHNVMAISRYFVTVNLDHLQQNMAGYDLPRRSSYWQEVSAKASALVSRLDVVQQRFVFEGAKPKVCHPSPQEDVVPQLALLNSRLNAKERPLLLKKLFKRITEV
jgi:hypothetical protein